MTTCKECLHYEACKAFNRMRQNVIDASSSGAEKLCGRFADKSRFIELPCKVGDTAWVLVDQIKTPLEARVRSMLIGKDTIDFNCAVKGYYAVTVNSDDFGESFFLTKEEAEAALAERTKNEI